MKGREFRTILRDASADPKVIRVLIEMGEEMSYYRRQIMDLARLVGQCMDLVSKTVEVSEALKKRLDRIGKRFEDFDAEKQ